MSQAFYNSTWNGLPVQVMAGWDGIDSELFVKVFYVDDDGEPDEEPGLVLDAWTEVFPCPTEKTGDSAALVSWIQERLDPLGIKLPQAMLAEVLAHMMMDDNRTQVMYDASGNRSSLID